MKKVGLFVIALLLLGAALYVYLEPTGSLLAKLRGETFFDGLPVSYWQQQLAEDDPAARKQAWDQLVAGNADATPVAREILRGQDPASNMKTRRAAAEILGAIGGDAAAAAEDLVAATKDGDAFLPLLAATALPKVEAPDTDAVPALTALLKRQPTVEVLRALSEYKSKAKPALDTLSETLANKQLPTEVRWNAARTIGKIHAEAVDAVPLLVQHLKDKEATVREHCAEALGDIGPGAKTAIPDLVAVLTDPFKRVRRDAVRSLRQVGPDAKQALPEIRKLVDDPEEMVRHATKETLRTLAPDEPIPPRKGRPEDQAAAGQKPPPAEKTQQQDASKKQSTTDSSGKK